jgi:hypothetical protein
LANSLKSGAGSTIRPADAEVPALGFILTVLESEALKLIDLVVFPERGIHIPCSSL